MPQFAMPSSSRNLTRMKAPPHPFPELQGPFEESMSELDKPEEIEVPSDAASRRTILLDAPTYQRVIAGRWKQRVGEKYHPLWKIVAQLSFGIHLLADNLAKSEEEVMQILQGHIDEIDLFLERTTEDFALAQDDIQERMRCLQLPLQHPKVFDRMLEDRAFRTSIVDGNEKIEHIVARTSFAMRDSLKDAQKGLDATHSLQQYLASLEYSWGRRSAGHETIFEAMLENVEGWRDAFVDLHAQGGRLGQMLKQLTDVINQMQQRAGEISRRLVRAQQQTGETQTNSRNITYIARQSTSTNNTSRSGTPDEVPRKPLPGVPDRSSARQLSSFGQRCDTPQSTRSAKSHLSGDPYGSRTSSRTDTHGSTRDSAQARLGSRSPRLVEIRRPSPNGQERSSTGSTHTEPVRTSRSKLVPVELPAEMPQAPLRTSPVTHLTNSNTGLGIIDHNQPSQPLAETLTSISARAGSRNLPLTPSSMNSDAGPPSKIAQELSAEPVHRTTPEPLQSLNGKVTEPIPGSPPSTPTWAKQNFDNSDRNRMKLSKTAFRSHPPNLELGSPPVLNSNQFGGHRHGPNGSLASSIGAPGPEIDANASANSSPIQNTASNLKQSLSKKSNEPRIGREVSKKAFIAELEGTTPMAIRPAAQSSEEVRQKQRENIRELNQIAVELEAPQILLPAQPVQQLRAQTIPSVTTIDESVEEDSEAVDGSQPTDASVLFDEQNEALDNKVVAAIRRSFIAINIELPGAMHFDADSDALGKSAEPQEETPVQSFPERPESPSAQDNLRLLDTHRHHAANLPEAGGTPIHRHQVEDVSCGGEEMVAELDELSAASPKLSLKGEETMLAILPAKTYIVPNTQASPVYKTTAPPLRPIPQHNGSPTSPGSSRGLRSPNRSRPEITGRKSSESSASSQHQWRAFFKGQLSPSEIASTPPLPVNSGTHKGIVHLQKPMQELSPTLGWQWAPETPEVEPQPAGSVGH